jgi:sortase A
LVRLFRLAGGFLGAAGLVLLLYGGYSYLQASITEKQMEAEVPGQATQTAQLAPAVTATAVPATATATQTTTLPPPTTTPPILPSSTNTLQLSATSPSATPARSSVESVGPGGLPRGDGADPERLVIPRLKLDTRVEEATWAMVDENGTATSEWQIPFDAVGHLVTTAKPGEAGNAVISGHQNLIGPDQFGLGKFAGLWNLATGDDVYIVDKLGRIFLFRVSNHYVLQEAGMPLSVREANFQRIMKDSNTAIATFETCWNGVQAPLSGNTYRWVVVANLVGTVRTTQVPNRAN